MSKKNIIVGGIFAFFLILIIAGATGKKTSDTSISPTIETKVSTPSPTAIPSPSVTPTKIPTPKPTVYIPPPTQYIAPPTSVPQSAPVIQNNNGATALCNDGTYSYAENHRGACSKHDGVKEFYK